MTRTNPTADNPLLPPLGEDGRPANLGWLAHLRLPRTSVFEFLAYAYLTLLILSAIFAERIPGLARPNFEYGDFSEYPTLTLSGILGTDALGRSISSRVIYGARTSLTIATIATLISLTFGILLGMFAGFYRGLLERMVDLYANTMSALPPILVLLSLVAATGASVLTMTITLGLLGIGAYARITKGTVISQNNSDYVLAARALGARDSRLLAREILPNLLPTLTALVPPQMAGLIVTEGSLSFLGYGIPPPSPSWGSMIAGSTDLMNRFPLLIFGPILAIGLTVYSLNTVGDHLARRINVREGQL